MFEIAKLGRLEKEIGCGPCGDLRDCGDEITGVGLSRLNYFLQEREIWIKEI